MNMISKLENPEYQQSAIQSVVETLLYPSFGFGKEMAGSSHTLACCLSKLRSSLEAGKKQIRVWLQYVCGVKEDMMTIKVEFVFKLL